MHNLICITYTKDKSVLQVILQDFLEDQHNQIMTSAGWEIDSSMPATGISQDS